MKVIIQLGRDEEAKALPILLRHAPGTILPERTYLLGEDTVDLLRNAGVQFTQLSRETIAPCLKEAAVERDDIFVPLCYHNGSAIEPVKLQDLQSRLLQRFNGLIYFPQAKQGFGKLGEITYRDENVIYRVISEDSSASREYLGKLKEHLKRELQQLDVLTMVDPL